MTHINFSRLEMNSLKIKRMVIFVLSMALLVGCIKVFAEDVSPNEMYFYIDSEFGNLFCREAETVSKIYPGYSFEYFFESYDKVFAHSIGPDGVSYDVFLGQTNEITYDKKQKSVELFSVTGKANETTVYNYLKNTMGFKEASICGALANIQSESSFNPAALGDGGNSYGICQWHNSRWDKLKTWCSNNGYDYTTLNGQLHFMEYELKSYTGAYEWVVSVANTADGAYTAGYRWASEYEGCSAVYFVQRGNLARDTYWQEYGTVTVPKPTITQPTNGDQYVHPGGFGIRWDSVSGASKYLMYIRNLDTDKILPSFNGKDCGTDTYLYIRDTLYSDFIDGANYRVAIKAVHSGASDGGTWSECEFKTAQRPTITSELDGANPTNATISWSAVQGASEYRITLLSTDGTDIVHQNESMGTKTYVVERNLKYNTEYKLNVAAIISGQTSGTYDLWLKETYYFTTDVQTEYSTLIYDANGGINAPPQQNATVGDAVTVSQIQPSRYGYTFLGWNYTPTSTVGSCRGGQTVYMSKETITLYAIWSANSYTLTFDANGGLVTPTRSSVTYDSIYGTLPIPTLSGYSFEGWYTSKNYSEKITQDSTVSIAGEHTLYAKWSTSNADVTGVAVNKNSVSINIGESEILTATVLPANATNKAVTWKSSNDSVATVLNGVVTAISAGTATINVTTAVGAFTATCTVTVIQNKPLPTTNISIGNIAGLAGDEVEVPISVSGNSGLAMYNFKLNYDNTRLEPLTITKGTPFNAGTLTSNIQQGGDLSALTYVTAYFTNPSNITSDGTLFTVKFRVREAAEGVIPLTLTYAAGDVCDQGYNDVAVNVQNGAVTIGAEPQYDYTINSLKITNAAGSEIAIPSSGSFYTRINVTKNSTRSAEDYIIAAAYDESGTLLDITYMSGSFAQGQTVSFGGLLKIPSGSNVGYVKAYVWNSLSDMTSLAAVKTKTK